MGESEFRDVELVYNSGDAAAGNLWISLQNSGAGRSHFDNVRLDAAVIPEPSGLFLLVLGIAGIAARRRRR